MKSQNQEKEIIAMSKFVEASKKITKKVVEGYKKNEDGETVEETKKRLSSDK